jgi:hypothetical protein
VTAVRMQGGKPATEDGQCEACLNR